MSLLDQLKGEIAGLDGAAKHEFLSSIGVDAPAPAAPAKPQTLLDHLRAAGVELLADAFGIAATDLPTLHEIAPMIGLLVKAVDDLDKRITAVEHPADVPDKTAAVAAPPVGAVTQPPADATAASLPDSPPANTAPSAASSNTSTGSAS